MQFMAFDIKKYHGTTTYAIRVTVFLTGCVNETIKVAWIIMLRLGTGLEKPISIASVLDQFQCFINKIKCFRFDLGSPASNSRDLSSKCINTKYRLSVRVRCDAMLTTLLFPYKKAVV